MRMRDIYGTGEFRLSIEIFPPKTEAGDAALFENLQRLVEYRPAFVSCTYGAGGSTRARTIDLCDEIQKRYHVPATAHLTCVGATRDELQTWIQDARGRGVNNIMALRGDAPAGANAFPQVDGGLRYANQLVELIRNDFPEMGIAVGGYPETHQEAPSPAADLENLQRKVDAGADVVITQLFYDNDDFFRFRDRCDALGITVPIVPGVLPVTNFAQIERIASLCGARLPAGFEGDLKAAGDDKDAQFRVGVEFATAQCAALIENGVPGMHFYVLNRSEATSEVLRRIALLGGKSDK